MEENLQIWCKLKSHKYKKLNNHKAEATKKIPMMCSLVPLIKPSDKAILKHPDKTETQYLYTECQHDSGQKYWIMVTKPHSLKETGLNLL